MNTLIGTAGMDLLTSLQPNGTYYDIIFGLAGNDLIIGGDQDDTLFGGSESDVLEGGAGADELFGESGDDVLDGGSGIDILDGGSEDDQLFGGFSNDILIGGTGADLLDGGDGFDTASYATAAGPVTVNLANGTGTRGDADGDTLISIETVIGSAFDDTLIGGNNAFILEKLYGGAGNDRIFGGNTDDILLGEAGEDRIFGGGGSDSMVGGSENDQLFGQGGNDILQGNDGDDELFGGQNNDQLIGGTGADLLDGGPGRDTASYYGSASGVVIDLLAGLGFAGEAAGDVLVSIEQIDGSDFDDTIWGSNGDDDLGGGAGGDDFLRGLGGEDRLSGGSGFDTLFGNNGRDRLFGGDDDDVLSGGAGADVLNGGAGTDTATYETAVSGIVVDLSTGLGSAGEANGDELFEIEVVIGSAFGDTITTSANDGDSLFGLGGEDVLNGNTGRDILDGGADADQLFGNEGDDVLTGGGDADLLDGGQGIDTASYAGSQSGVTVTLTGGPESGGDAEGDVLVDIENVVGSEHDDILAGHPTVANVLSGGGGEDSLFGYSNDTLLGGDDNDGLVLASTNGVADGGAGFDELITGFDALDASDFSSNRLIGGADRDLFNFQDSAIERQMHYIEDFEDGLDLISFQPGGPTAFSDLTVYANGSDTIVEVNGASRLEIVLVGIDPSALDSSDFTF